MASPGNKRAVSSCLSSLFARYLAVVFGCITSACGFDHLLGAKKGCQLCWPPLRKVCLDLTLFNMSKQFARGLGIAP